MVSFVMKSEGVLVSKGGSPHLTLEIHSCQNHVCWMVAVTAEYGVVAGDLWQVIYASWLIPANYAALSRRHFHNF